MIAGILLLIAGCTQISPSTGPGSPSPLGMSPSVPGTPSIPTPSTLSPVIGAYWFLYPNPDDDTYQLVMSVQDQIPWRKINRLYIGFATVHDGVLTDLPAGNSADDAAHREETRSRIRNAVTLCRQNNPDAEIFISSNFGGKEMDDQYLLAAQDPQKFADSVVAYLKDYGLDGYDMDWESSNIDNYAPQLKSLLSTTHTTLASAGNCPLGKPYLLTHTVWPGVESAETAASLMGSVDQLNLMTYGTGNKYDLVSTADSLHQAGIPYGLMVGGLESETGYVDNVGPDTPESVAAKCAYVKANSLAGLFEWRMDNDMRPDNSPPTFQLTGWMGDCLSG